MPDVNDLNERLHQLDLKLCEVVSITKIYKQQQDKMSENLDEIKESLFHMKLPSETEIASRRELHELNCRMKRLEEFQEHALPLLETVANTTGNLRWVSEHWKFIMSLLGFLLLLAYLIEPPSSWTVMDVFKH